MFMNNSYISNPWVFRVAKVVDGKCVNELVEKHRTQAGAIISMQFYLNEWLAMEHVSGEYTCYVSRLDGTSLSAYGTKTIRAYSKGREAMIKTSSQIIIDHRIK